MKIKNLNKIFIVGPPASGKTFLSDVLSKKLFIKNQGLDSFFWEKKFSKKANEKSRNLKLNKFLKNKKWVLEGSYFGRWTNKIYNQSEIIVSLDVPKRILTKRLLLNRFFKNKKKFPSKEERNRLKMIIKNTEEIKKEITKKLNERKVIDKVIFLKGKRDIRHFINQITPS